MKKIVFLMSLAMMLFACSKEEGFNSSTDNTAGTEQSMKATDNDSISSMPQVPPISGVPADTSSYYIPPEPPVPPIPPIPGVPTDTSDYYVPPILPSEPYVETPPAVIDSLKNAGHITSAKIK